MKPVSLMSGFVFLGLLLSPLLATSGLQPAHAPAPLYPIALTNEAVNYGVAWVACTVDDDGRVLETWTLRTSHPAFAEAAETALIEWRYEVRSAPSAAPWPRSEVVRFDFGRPGNVASFSALESIKGIFPYQPESLSAPESFPLLPSNSLKRLSGALPRPPAGVPPGRVLAEFVVDATGRVRVPVALEADHLEHARVVVSALREWRFERPVTSLEAPAVRLRWAFRFGPPATRVK
jgi:hypothetical protein